MRLSLNARSIVLLSADRPSHYFAIGKLKRICIVNISMAQRGVWQLKKLIINYCNFGGSSRGARDFVQVWLPRFRDQNPQLDIGEEMRRGRHPCLHATYRNGSERSVCVRNQPPEEILRQAALLRSCIGRKASLQVKQRTRSRTPSIQGGWTPQLQDLLRHSY